MAVYPIKLLGVGEIILGKSKSNNSSNDTSPWNPPLLRDPKIELPDSILRLCSLGHVCVVFFFSFRGNALIPIFPLQNNVEPKRKVQFGFLTFLFYNIYIY